MPLWISTLSYIIYIINTLDKKLKVFFGKTPNLQFSRFMEDALPPPFKLLFQGLNQAIKIQSR